MLYEFIYFRDCIKNRDQNRDDYNHVAAFAHYELAMLLLQCNYDVIVLVEY